MHLIRIAIGAVVVCALPACGSSGTATGKVEASDASTSTSAAPFSEWQPPPSNPNDEPPGSTGLGYEPGSSSSAPGNESPTGSSGDSTGSTSTGTGKGSSGCSCSGSYNCEITGAGVSTGSGTPITLEPQSGGGCNAVETVAGQSVTVGTLSGCSASASGATFVLSPSSGGGLSGCGTEGGVSVCVTCTPQ